MLRYQSIAIWLLTRSVTSMWPGAWVMQNSGLTAATTDCGDAGPEHGNLARQDLDRVAVVGLGYICDTDQGRITQMHRRAMHRGKTRSDLDGAYRVRRLQGRMDTTRGPPNTPARCVGTLVRYMGTLQPCWM